MTNLRTRRTFMKQAAGTMALAGLSRRVRAQETIERPNILFLYSDDQRADAMGCAGNPVIQTPEHDRLARDGVLFENCFVTTSICCVSRACALTGQYARRHGVDDFFKVLSAEQMQQTYPGLLRQNGYWTGFIGKWGLGANTRANIEAASDYFDFWAGGGYQTNFWHERTCPFVTCDPVDQKTQNQCTCPADSRGAKGEKVRVGKENITDPVHQTTEIVPMRVRHFLERRDPSKPFCLSVSFKTPHGPWQDYPELYADMYADTEMPIPKTATTTEALKQPECVRRSLESQQGARWAANPDIIAAQMRHYYRAIATQDYAIGEIRKALAEAGVADNTVIVFASDNGHFMGEHGLLGKWLMHEESIRVPCIIHDPRLPADQRGTRRSQMILNIDFAPTMLALAGVAAPASMQGQNLLPLVGGAEEAGRTEWFYEHVYEHGGAITPCEGVRTRDWKYICYYKEEPVVEQLFDLRHDPLEQQDLAAIPEHADRLEQLRTACARYREDLR